MKQVFLIVALAILSQGCFDVLNIRGEGPIVSQELDIEEINSIILEGSFDVHLSQGTQQSIVARGQQNIIDKLNTSVNDGTWEASLKKGNYRNFDLEIDVVLPELNYAGVEGSGNLYLYGLQLDELEINSDGSGDVIGAENILITSELNINMSGSGQVELTSLEVADLTARLSGSGGIYLIGQSEAAKFTVRGSGDVKAFSLTTGSSVVDVASSGNVDITANNTLDVMINGSGDVSYKGSPSITQSINGSGRLIDKN